MPSEKKPRFMDIDIVVAKLPEPTKEWPQGYSFELQDGHGKDLERRLDFRNDNHPGFIVVFNLVEADKHNPTGCQFLPDTNDAMWVQQSDLPEPPCPGTPSYWEQFRAVDVVDHGAQAKNRALIVYNKNDYEKMFAFTFRFEIPGVTKVVVFDPIGSNQNGGQ